VETHEGHEIESKRYPRSGYNGVFKPGAWFRFVPHSEASCLPIAAFLAGAKGQVFLAAMRRTTVRGLLVKACPMLYTLPQARASALQL
jgi:hypothetical protein